MTCRCGRPTRDDAYVCDKCEGQLERALSEVPFLDQELETTLTRQRAIPTSGSAPSAETPIPWHDRAAQVRRNLDGLLSTWVRFCAEENLLTADLPADTAAAKSRWLLRALPALRLHDIAPEAHDEITDAAADARRLVFWKRKNRVYLGPCAYGNSLADQLSDCPGDVYADEGEPVGYCEECERGVTVVTRQSELDDDLSGRLLSAADIADWSVRMGLDAKREEVRKRVLYWHRHKRITAARTEDRVPLFRYREVRPMLLAEYDDRRDTA